MNKITTLKKDISALEDQAAKLNHADTSGDYYKNLYELLAVAFFKAKDIIELYDDVNPVVDDSAQIIDKLRTDYALLEAQNDIYLAENNKLTDMKIDLEAKDAQITKIQTRVDEIAAYAKQLEAIRQAAIDALG